MTFLWVIRWITLWDSVRLEKGAPAPQKRAGAPRASIQLSRVVDGADARTDARVPPRRHNKWSEATRARTLLGLRGSYGSCRTSAACGSRATTSTESTR